MLTKNFSRTSPKMLFLWKIGLKWLKYTIFAEKGLKLFSMQDSIPLNFLRKSMTPFSNLSQEYFVTIYIL